MTSISIERVYPHRIEKLWQALTTPELLERWLMPNDFRPEVGHQFTFRTDPGPGFDGIVHCQVLEIEEPRLLRLSWKGGPIDTEVTFRLEAVDDGAATRLHMQQTGFVGFKAWLVSRILKLGSRSIYGKRLPQVLDEMETQTSTATEPIAERA